MEIWKNENPCFHSLPGNPVHSLLTYSSGTHLLHKSHFKYYYITKRHEYQYFSGHYLCYPIFELIIVEDSPSDKNWLNDFMVKIPCL